MRQVLLAASLGLLVTLFGTPVAIRGLVRQGYGQLIRDDGPTSHHTKRGTPTMGGAVIILGTLIGYFGSHALTWSQATVSGLLVLFLMTGLGLVGFLDDYIKVAKQRSLGLRAWAKLGGQMVVAVVFAILAMNFPDFPTDFTPASTEISFIRDTGLVLGPVLFVVWAYIMIAGTSNGVNLADGLDGLATGDLGDGLRVVRPHGHLAVQPELRDRADAQVLRGARPARPGRGRRRDHGRLLRLPVVERVARQDLHGRHRLAGPRRRARRPGDHRPAPSCCSCSSAACSCSSRCR